MYTYPIQLSHFVGDLLLRRLAELFKWGFHTSYSNKNASINILTW